MGFKCPICLKDFFKDKEKFNEHIKKEHKGIANNFKIALQKTTEKEPEK